MQHPPLSVMVRSTLPRSFRGSFLLVPVLSTSPYAVHLPPRSPNGLAWLPGGNPVGRSRRFPRVAAVPSSETTWTAPRREWAGNLGARRESWAPIGQCRSKHPSRWGGAGSGRRRRRLRRLWRFRPCTWNLQVPCAGLSHAEGAAGR